MVLRGKAQAAQAAQAMTCPSPRDRLRVHDALTCFRTNSFLLRLRLKGLAWCWWMCGHPASSLSDTSQADRGAIPQTPRIGRTAGAMNIPLFDDEARATVGTDFKRKGRFEAQRDEREGGNRAKFS